MAEIYNVSLDDVLSRVAGTVTYAGVKYVVKPISAIGLQLVQRLESGIDPQPPVEDVLALARKLCPTLPDEAWNDESGELMGIIIGVAQVPLRKVQAILPNSSGPTTNPSPASESPNA